MKKRVWRVVFLLVVVLTIFVWWHFDRQPQEIDPLATVMIENVQGLASKLSSCYGKVIDQDGKPLADATVKGALAQAISSKFKEGEPVFITKSDHEGQFQFMSLREWKLKIIVEKAGYETGIFPDSGIAIERTREKPQVLMIKKILP